MPGVVAHAEFDAADVLPASSAAFSAKQAVVSAARPVTSKCSR